MEDGTLHDQKTGAGEDSPPLDDDADHLPEDALEAAMRDAEAQSSGPWVPPDLPRRLTAVLILVTGLFWATLFGYTAVFAAAGPELFADAEGGDLYVGVEGMCYAPLPGDDPCFAHVNVTVVYENGVRHVLQPYENGTFVRAYRVLGMETARATVILESNLGTSEREVWAVRGTREDVGFHPTRGVEIEVIGRDNIAGFRFGALATLATVSVLGAAVWWARGGLGAAMLTKVVVAAGALIAGGSVIAYLMMGVMHWLFLGLALWLWFLYRRMRTWLAAARPTAVG